MDWNLDVGNRNKVEADTEMRGGSVGDAQLKVGNAAYMDSVTKEFQIIMLERLKFISRESLTFSFDQVDMKGVEMSSSP